jgi:hypothetical protein
LYLSIHHPLLQERTKERERKNQRKKATKKEKEKERKNKQPTKKINMFKNNKHGPWVLRLRPESSAFQLALSYEDKDNAICFVV